MRPDQASAAVIFLLSRHTEDAALCPKPCLSILTFGGLLGITACCGRQEVVMATRRFSVAISAALFSIGVTACRDGGEPPEASSVKPITVKPAGLARIGDIDPRYQCITWRCSRSRAGSSGSHMVLSSMPS